VLRQHPLALFFRLFPESWEKKGLKSVMPSILIVDDEQHIRLLIEQTLEDLEDQGVILLTASNGEEALAVIKESKPELVFLDVMMPKMNGFDVCNTVKHDLGMKTTHIVLLTAKGQEFDRQHGLDVGADTYITKPFDPDLILQKTMDVLGL
jgi:two-component system alkaline phosphatase synthesis response regulator PhoP